MIHYFKTTLDIHPQKNISSPARSTMTVISAMGWKLLCCWKVERCCGCVWAGIFYFYAFIVGIGKMPFLCTLCQSFLVLKFFCWQRQQTQVESPLIIPQDLTLCSHIAVTILPPPGNIGVVLSICFLHESPRWWPKSNFKGCHHLGLFWKSVPPLSYCSL